MPTSDWAPDVAAVGAILRARTIDANGAEAGTFTPGTRPTDAQVGELIGDGVGAVTGEFGTADYDPQLWPAAKRMAALEAAMLVELSYFPEQVATGRSPYEQIVALRDRAAAALTKAFEDVGAGDEVGPVDDRLLPVFGFPADKGGMVGWGTRW